jgi:hypothetical protein
MNKLFLHYIESLELKELGFDEPCFAKFSKKEFRLNSLGGGSNYNNGSFGINIISSPLYSQAFKFFRDKYNLLVSPFQSLNDITDEVKNYYFEIGNIGELKTLETTNEYSTYEEAELECIKKLIVIVKS